MPLLLQGLLGFSIAAPVGPIGVLCIRRTLADGRLAGFLSGLFSAYASTFLLTVTNPMTILAFLGIFSAILPSNGTTDAASSASLVLGVFLGSAFWWLALSGLVGLFRERFTPVWMQWVNRVSGVVVTVFAITILT